MHYTKKTFYTPLVREDLLSMHCLLVQESRKQAPNPLSQPMDKQTPVTLPAAVPVAAQTQEPGAVSTPNVLSDVLKATDSPAPAPAPPAVEAGRFNVEQEPTSEANLPFSVLVRT
jgi:hypothetical protein